MANLLVKNIDANHRIAEKDRQGCYKRGDVVEVRNDHCYWGREELRPRSQGGKLSIVKVPGYTAMQLEAVVYRKYNCLLVHPYHRDTLGILRRRRLHIDLPEGDGPFSYSIDDFLSILSDKTR